LISRNINWVLQLGEVNLFSVIKSIWTNFSLVRRLVVREVERKFKGTVFGLVWTIIGPLLMLATYSFAFGTVFGARWVTSDDPNGIPYPLAIFSGLMLAGIFMELLGRSPSLVLENVSYVKKVVFPLEIIPAVALGSALVTTCITFLVFFAFYFYSLGLPPVTTLLIPLEIVPLLCLTLGLSYLLASLGVFLRDIGQIVPAISTALLLTSTTFFQPEQVPQEWQTLMLFNPLTIPITGFRDLVFHGNLPDMSLWFAHFAASLLILAAGAFWFQKTKRAFADVL
jgi:lipopolysaccharide transport system permease protein